MNAVSDLGKKEKLDKGGAQAGPSDPQFSSHTRQLSHLQNRISHSPTRGCRYFSGATQVARALATSCCSSLPKRADLEHHRAKQDSAQKGNNTACPACFQLAAGCNWGGGEKFHLPKTGNLLCSPSWNGHDGQPPRRGVQASRRFSWSLLPQRARLPYGCRM